MNTLSQWIFLAYITFLALVCLPANAVESRSPEPRYLLLNGWTFQVDEINLQEYQRCVDAAAKHGFNATRLSITWSNLEKSPGVYDFKPFDQYVDYALSRGMKIALSLHFGHMAWDKLPGDWLARNSAGQPHQLSFSSIGANAKMQEVLKALTRHYAAKCPKQILFVQTTFTMCAETEFEFQFDASSDSSLASIEGFHQYLAKGYGTIQELNRIWKTSFTTFDQLTIPPDYHDTAGLAWYLFRTKTIKKTLDDLAAICHQSGLAYGVQFGSVWDGMAPKRGTILFPYLCEKADWVTIDDAPKYDHCFSTDLVRGSLKGKRIANEIDGPTSADDTTYIGLGSESFDHGFNLISVANWSSGTLQQRTELWKPLAKRLKDPVHRTPATELMKVSALELLRQGAATAIERYRKINPDGKKILDLMLVDDITPFLFPKGKEPAIVR